MKRLFKKITAVLLSLTVILSLSVTASAKNSDFYIKVFNNVNVRTGAGISYDILGKAPAGSEFTYLGSKFDLTNILWYKIEDKNGLRGWVSSDIARRYPVEKVKTALSEFESDGSAFDDIQEYINKMRVRYGAVGIQVAAIRGSDGRVLSWTDGYAKNGEKEMTKDTKIRVASISKVIVAMCALKMEEDGIVDINKKIDTYWGKKLPNKVTLNTLLTHTSGLRYLGIKTTKKDFRNQLLEKQNYSTDKGGKASAWMYNNYGYSIAAATLELASKKSLDDYARDNLFAPLDIDVSFFSARINDQSHFPYLYDADGSVEMTASEAKKADRHEKLVADAGVYIGGLTGTAKEIAKLYYILANDGKYRGEQILSEESVEKMEQQYFSAKENGGSFKQCLGLRYRKNIYGTSGIYYHTGNAYGVLALASYNPETKDVVVVLTTGAAHTRDAQGVYKICSLITQKIYKNIDEI